MARTFRLDILTPEHEFFDEQVTMLTVTAADGQLCILPGHSPLMAAVREGELSLRLPSGEEKWAAASDGFITITQDEVVLMLESAEWPEDIDRVRAERAERKARELLLQKQDRSEYLMTQSMLLRAMTRLRVSSRRKIN